MSAPTDPSLSNGPTAGDEFFSAAAYGVSASPRVTNGTDVKRGGGYEKLGSSYVVKGQRYHPTADQPASQTGRASWYGNAFHGRMTANGEVFDMNHLTAVHKTMPLPSYARVTNVKNGNSLIVRVNDRGPFSNNRVIDVSKRAAEALDFINAGTADVRVEYVGPAPLHGNDDDFLIASINNSDLVRPRGPAPVFAGFIPERPASPIGFAPSEYADWRVQSAFDALLGQTHR